MFSNFSQALLPLLSNSSTLPCPSISHSLTVSLLCLLYFSKAHKPPQLTWPYFSSEERNHYALPGPSTWTLLLPLCIRVKEALLLLKSPPGSIPSYTSSITYIFSPTNQMTKSLPCPKISLPLTFYALQDTTSWLFLYMANLGHGNVPSPYTGSINWIM